jgi:uncharacterized membrane protein HdeD (DUF308 family)
MVNYVLVKASQAIAIRGAIAVALGIIALALPGPTFLALAIAFGSFAMLDGIMALFALFDRHSKVSRGWLVFEAIAGIVAGITTFMVPLATAIALTYLIATWAMITGAIKIAAAIALRKEIQREWLLVSSGIVSILFGALLALMPIPGIIGLMWAVGIYGLIAGTLLIVLSLRLRRARELPPAEVRPRAA